MTALVSWLEARAYFSYQSITERRLIQSEGKPVSETIIEERR